MSTDRSWGIAGLWNASLDTDRQRPLEPREHVWASEVGGSYYDRYWKMKGRAPTTPPNLRSRRKFEAGHLFEWSVAQVLKRAGVLHTTQDHIVNPRGMLLVTGRADFMASGKIADVSLEDLPETFGMIAEATLTKLREAHPDGLREQGLEIKSCSAFMFEKYLRAPGDHHALQAFHYAHVTERPFVLVYICRDDLRIAEWIILPESQKWGNLYYGDLNAMADILKLSEEEIKNYKEPLIIWNPKENRFTKNFKVEYSLYLTDYGFERPDEYAEPVSKMCSGLNRVAKRLVEGAKLTKNNLEWIEKGKAFDPLVGEVFSKLIEENKPMLTLEKLKNMESDSIFASGVANDDPEGINLAGTGMPLRWVACRGGIHDWAIYAQAEGWTEEEVKERGDKLFSEDTIKKLVPCETEAFAMYRY